MIFTDPLFFVLMASCWVTFFAVPRTLRLTALAAWSAVFYWLYAGAFVLVIAALVAAIAIGQRYLSAAVGATLVALLIYFKLPATVIVPLGFSYLAFELLHVVIDRHLGKLPAAGFTPLLAYAFFLPCRIAGPIRRLPQFLAAVEAATPSAEHVYRGGLRILMGLAKKVIVADTLALTVAELSYVDRPMHAWTIVFAYSLQLYFDFSAYSDLAIGFSRTLGIAVPENFNYPYFAVSIREFWNRWHMTLSNWVRDYVFLPLGRRLFTTGLRAHAVAIAAISYVITFAIVGAWHGLTAGFLLWGVYHGVLLAGHQLVQRWTPRAVAAHPWYRSRAAAAVSILITFFFVMIGWVPFMTDTERAIRLLSLMFFGRAA
jgi:alginate O-acetyltransferase complex protein AlgI